MNDLLDKLEAYLALAKAATGTVAQGCDAGIALLEYVKSTVGQFLACDPSQASRLAACCDGLEECRKTCSAAPAGGAQAGVTPGQIIAAILALLNIFFPKA